MDGWTIAPLTSQSFQFSVLLCVLTVIKQSATGFLSELKFLFWCWFKLRRNRHLLQGVMVAFLQDAIIIITTSSSSSSSRRKWIGWGLHGGLNKQVVAVRIKKRGRTFYFLRDEVESWIKVMGTVHLTASDEFSKNPDESCKRKT